MQVATEKKAAPTTKSGDEVVRMYPANELGKPVRAFKDTFSAGQVMKDAFFQAG